ncbi:MAG: bifunctional nuclease family protein [Bacteroidales bacterium]|nr:bifunctional nuclease family protein [Bacteroidales bacterium]
MDDRVKLRVMGLSYNQLQSGAFALLLAQEDGPYRIPIVIGPAEAQSIAMRIEHMTPPRPLTHDLFVSFAQAFGVRLKEVFIYKFEDGIFSSELTFSDGERQIVLDARTSDAIAIAMRTNAPILTTNAILNETGFIVDETEDDDGETHATLRRSQADNLTNDEPRLENLALEELENQLQQAIDSENYEEAARISEIIKRKKNT